MSKNKLRLSSLLIAFGLGAIIVIWNLPQNNAISTLSNPSHLPSSSSSKDNGAVRHDQQQTSVEAARQSPVSALSPDTPKEINDAKAAFRTDDSVITKDGRTFPLRTYQTMLTPNDPSYNQWWVSSNSMPEVWDIPPTVTQTKIAVIDTGFALNHQEFTGRWATNNGESGLAIAQAPSDLNCSDQGLALNKNCNNIDDNYDGIVDNESGSTTSQNPSKLNCSDQGLALNKNCNNIDDDSNGYIDDYRGFDFTNFDASVQAGEVNPTGSGTYHGTMVAGVLGATGNNGVGIAGVNWHTFILPIQSINDNGYGDSYTVGQAIYYAADQGANIISLSLGTAADDPYLRLAILYALDHGALVVAASGNDGCNCITYPANYPEVLAVGALAPTGAPASFSNYGAQLDILAPGQSITTSTYTAANSTSAYTTGSGTSFATPFVSGLLGLAKENQPTAEWEEIIGAMLENSDRRTLTAATPRSINLGYGVTKANSMLARLRNGTNERQRYQFSGGTILGSKRAYQCQSTIPATPYYELTKNGVYQYTTDLRELSKATQNGFTARQVTSVCMGLPTDTVDILRLIDIPNETLNLRLKQ